MQLTRALQWLNLAAAVGVMTAMGLNAIAQTAAPSAKNKAPTASITSPANNASFPAGSNITITATATDSDGTVTKVDFLSGSTVIGTDTTTPYSFTWPNVAAGTYSLTARATDDGLATGTSTAVTITVTPVSNAPPTVSITAPANGASYVAPASVVISANASDSNGSVTRVEFFQGTSSLGFVATPPYTLTWPNVGPGGYVLTAKATDNQGAITTSAPVSISVGAPPMVVMTSPDNCSTVTLPASVTLSADAVDTDGWIVSVDFYDGSTLLGSATRLPYSIVWTNPPAGPHSLTARATNNLGISAPSAPITLTVAQPNTPPDVNITAPAPDSTFRGGTTVTITANASDPDGFVKKVDFFYRTTGSGNNIFISSSNGPVFSVPWPSVPAGDFQLTAVATDNGDATKTSAPVHVTVTPNAPPTAHLTAPANGAAYRAPATIAFTATANDTDGTVSKVDFLLTGNKVATATTGPTYSATATNVPAGSYIVVARATDDGNATGDSPEQVTINVAANALPIVNITTPANGANITAPADVPITATASDPDGSITKVEFLVDNVLLKTVTTGAYSATWVNVPLGDHTILVRATDNDGAVGSATATIHVTGIRSEITAPPDGSSYVGPAAFDLVARLTDSSSTLTRVEFYDGSSLLVGVDLSPPFTPPLTYTLQMSQISPGTHVYTAKVIDSASRTATSPPITVVVTTPAPPAVTLTSPTQNSFYIAPASIVVTAVPAQGASIQKVDFLANGAQIASVTSPPYTFNWTDVATGSYDIVARATDSGNVVTNTPAVSVTVGTAPVLTLDAGIDQTTVADDRVNLSGTIQSPPNSAVLVNGQPATIEQQSRRWYMSALPLTPGSNSITVTANTLGAASSSLSLSVTSSGQQPFEIHFNTNEGIGPAAVFITVRQRGQVAFGRAEFDVTSNGSSQYTMTTLSGGEGTIGFTYPPGLYLTTVRVYDPGGSLVYSSSQRVNSIASTVMAARIASVYGFLSDKLAKNDPTSALIAITVDSHDRYQDIFAALGTSLPTVATQLGRPQVRVMTDQIAEMLVTRATQNGTRGFLVHLLKGPDGLWRIEGM